jgi:8-oxo-dGTP pyrophosphatase MutT (NUDIX family)
MNLKEQFEKYIPINEQEAKDKEIILKYINDFDDVLTRNNEYAHLCSSGFILNKNRTKVLMIHHNIYNSWGWTGGHADGNPDLLEVALKEAKEETGIINGKPIIEDIFSVDTLPVLGHYKRGKYVPAHTHLCATYILEADEKEALSICEDENSGVKWIPIDEVVDSSNEQHMKYVYSKIIDKIKKL